ncbi:MAG: hypothetical protein WAP34_09645 [Desulfomonilia bacterium]
MFFLYEDLLFKVLSIADYPKRGKRFIVAVSGAPEEPAGCARLPGGIDLGHDVIRIIAGCHPQGKRLKPGPDDDVVSDYALQPLNPLFHEIVRIIRRIGYAVEIFAEVGRIQHGRDDVDIAHDFPNILPHHTDIHGSLPDYDPENVQREQHALSGGDSMNP